MPAHRVRNFTQVGPTAVEPNVITGRRSNAWQRVHKGIDQTGPGWGNPTTHRPGVTTKPPGPATASKLRCKLGFFTSLLAGNVGRGMVGPLVERQYKHSGPRLTHGLRRSLLWRYCAIGKIPLASRVSDAYRLSGLIRTLKDGVALPPCLATARTSRLLSTYPGGSSTLHSNPMVSHRFIYPNYLQLR